MKRFDSRVSILVCLVAAASCTSPSTDPTSSASAPSIAPNDATATGVSSAGGAQPATFEGIDIWVDPVAGDDSRQGHDRAEALRTVDAAWDRIPSGVLLTTGYRIALVAGTYPQATSVNYWEDRHGTAEAPIVVEAIDGPHTAVFEADINMYDVSHFSLLGVDIIREGDAFHCELCDHILIRDVELSGGTAAHETVKINQSQYISIENSEIHGADDNAIDFVAVQYGNVTGNRIHDAQDWCAYAKGGSAYLTFADNEIFDCGTGGITAGQGTGFEFMTPPFLNYEAYGIEIVNNVIHHTEGAGLGVAGGFNVLFAHNTLYDVGTRSHVVEFVRGRRGCDGSTSTCAANHDAGGWGSAAGEEQLIPNRHIYFFNNVVVNPAGVQSQWQHFQVDGPMDTPSSSGIPSPAVADDDLQIRSNVIWNGPSDHPLGTGEGCPDGNETCNTAQILDANEINTIEPTLTDPDNGDFSLTESSLGSLPAPVPIPRFVWDQTPIPVPPGPPMTSSGGAAALGASPTPPD